MLNRLHLFFFMALLSTQTQAEVMEWKQISSANFDAFYYGEREAFVERLLVNAEKSLKEAERITDYRLGGRVGILIYANQHHYLKSHAWKQNTAPIPSAGNSRLENHIVIVAESEEANTKKQISQSVAELLIYELLYGGSFQERLQSSTLLYLPTWFTKGLSAYIAETWSTETDINIKEAFETKAYHRFNQLNDAEAAKAGQSFWYFITQTYGEKSISDLLYMIRVSRNIDNSFQFVYGESLRKLYRGWMAFYENRYANDGGKAPFTYSIKLSKKVFPEKSIIHAAASPNSNQVILVSQKKGKQQLWLLNIDNGKYQRVKAFGQKHQVSHPFGQSILPIWKDQNNLFLHLQTDKGLNLILIDLKTKQELFLTNLPFDYIQSAVLSPDKKQLLYSAQLNNQSDIFELSLSTYQITSLTQDHHEDIDAVYAADQKSVFFASRRPSNTKLNDSSQTLIDSTNTDLFQLDLLKLGESPRRLLETRFINERNPTIYNDSFLAFISDNSGIYNLHLLKFNQQDSTFIWPFSDFSRHISNYQVLRDQQKEFFLLFFRGHYFLNWLEQSSQIENDALQQIPQSTTYRSFTGYQQYAYSPKPLLDTLQPITHNLITTKDTIEANAWFFQTGFSESPVTLQKSYKENTLALNRAVRPYKRTFAPDYLISNILDNSIIGTPYYENNEHSNLFVEHRRYHARLDVGVSDILNKHLLQVTLRLPLSLYGSDVWLDYRYRDKKWMFRQTALRMSRLGNATPDIRRIYLHEWRSSLTYAPRLNWQMGIGGVYRQDRQVVLSTDLTNLLAPNQNINRLGYEATISYQNIDHREQNLPRGIDFVAKWEHFVSSNKGLHFFVGGIQIKYYKKIHKNFTWASRLHYTVSGGPSNVAFRVGGVENWLGARVNGTLANNPLYGNGFIANLNGVRGFSQNTRNGQQALLFNTELRLPIHRIMFKAPISSEFIRQIQMIAFYDIASAWNGLSPFGEQHYNTRTIDQGTVKITVRNKNNPFISSFGYGVRMRLLGYFLRVDAAWAIDNGNFINQNKPIYSASIGLDF